VLDAAVEPIAELSRPARSPAPMRSSGRAHRIDNMITLRYREGSESASRGKGINRATRIFGGSSSSRATGRA